MEFHIGMDVVCIETHPNGIVKDGEVYTIKGLRIHPYPKCNEQEIDIGRKADNKVGDIVQCHKGHGITYAHSGIWWLRATRFKPLDTLVDISELTEVLENSAPFEIAK